MNSSLLTVVSVLAGAVILAFLVVFAMFLNLWLRIKAAGLPVGIAELCLIRIRNINPETLIDAMIALDKAGIAVSVGDLQTHVLSGGNLTAVTDALISAEKAELGFDFRRMAAIDLAGRDVVDAVNSRVSPKVLLCPPPSAAGDMIAGVAKDGVRVAVKARVTVRTQLDRLVGGAGEHTIVARVGEGIVAAIGSAESHRDILETPERISERLLAKGLDSGTCFEILSVDVADVDILDNVAARLRTARADADKRIAQAQAEVRRAAAGAVRQEMTAKTTDMRSRVVAAKANVPLAVSTALRVGRMGRHRALPPTINTRMHWRAAID